MLEISGIEQYIYLIFGHYGESGMNDSNDRRYIDRIIIPGAKVYYKKTSRFSCFTKFQGPLQLTDITKSAISVPKKLPFPKKIDLELKIIMPENEALSMKGKVRGIKEDANGKFVNTIIQFNPFGSEKEYNSFRTKKRLDQFLNKYYNSKE